MTLTPISSNAEGLNVVWAKLPPLPDPTGFAGAYAGTSGQALLVAGGANFPDKLPWEGGTKVWYDTGFVLEEPQGRWRREFRLPRPGGYGVSVTAREGIICVGGSNADSHFADAFILQWDGTRVKVLDLPALPVPIANAAGALLGREVCIAGGTDAPDATRALRRFFTLHLDRRAEGWNELPAWPGPARMLPVAAAVGGSLFVAGGADLIAGADGNPKRTYLKDGYRYTPGQGWRRIADMPNCVVAAPSPAPSLDGQSFLVIGGDDGSLLNFEPRSKHPGFPKRVLRYEIIRDRWVVLTDAPVSRATLPTTFWQGSHVLVSGEERPGVRSPEVWTVGNAAGEPLR